MNDTPHFTHTLTQRKRTVIKRWLTLTVAAGAAIASISTTAQVTPSVPPGPEGLKGISVPTPSTLSSYILDKPAAIRLGKALFWDMQVGSDGKTACASCHFQAGADSRSKNQITPGLLVRSSPSQLAPDNTFQIGGPNYQLKLADFPIHKFANPHDRNSAVVRTSNDAITSQGVFNEKFVGVTPGASVDTRSVVYDTVFHVGANNTRKVEPRNSPTVINSVFNFRNFWDGRAAYLFNGVNPFGARDANARVYQLVGSLVTPVQVRIDNASLASQASGPPGSNFEMSADGRSFMEIGKRLLAARPLALQKVSTTDSVLGSLANTAGSGLTTANYSALVKAAFKPEWWNGTQVINISSTGVRTVIPAPAALGASQYNHMQANFSLIFSLAVQLYEATLVADDTPFDRHMANQGSLNASQLQGMSVFFSKGKCSNCHGGAEFTNASVRKIVREPMARMVMGNGGTAVYDEGFYYISVTDTLDDILNGEKDPFNKPNSYTGLAQTVGNAEFERLIGIPANLTVGANERVAVKGAAKTPTVRNAELTSPYFHNGDSATLREVVEFYNRGGNFARQNPADLDADIQPLGLSEDEIANLIEFMKALTDDRVRYHAAPFDHPQLLLPNGHTGSTSSVTNDGYGRAVDSILDVPAVGANGYKSNKAATPASFLGTGLSGSPKVTLVSRADGRCVDVSTAGTTAGLPITVATCSAASNQTFQLVPADGGAYQLINAKSGLALKVRAASTADGAQLEQAALSAADAAQAWHLKDAGGGYYTVYNRGSGKCVHSQNNLGLQQACASLTTPLLSQQFSLILR